MSDDHPVRMNPSPPGQVSTTRLRRIVALTLIAASLTCSFSALNGDEDRGPFHDNEGHWTREFRLPDQYLPAGFKRDSKNKHWLHLSVDPGGAEDAYCKRYVVMATPYVSNGELSAKPGDPKCPLGYGGNKNFTEFSVGKWAGYRNMVYRSSDRYQFNSLFKVGSAVVAFYIDAGAASPKAPKAPRVPCPSEAEIMKTLGKLVDSYALYIQEQGWMNLTAATPAKPTSLAPPPKAAQDDIRIINGKRKKKCPSCGEYHIDVQDEAPVSPPPPVPEEITPDPSEGIVSGETPLMETQEEEISPAATALGTLAVSGITAIGAGLMMLGMGVTPKDLVDGAKELFGGATAPPVEPPPLPPPMPVTHRDGETNEFGEVWSSFSGGFVGRKTYEQDMASRAWIADKNEADLHSGQSEDVKAAYDKLQESKQKLEEEREEGRMLIKKENLRQWVEDREKEMQERSYWTDVKDNYIRNVNEELDQLPHELFEAARESAKAVKAGVNAVVDVVKDATNWEILRATGAQTAKDLIGSPLKSAGKVNKLFHDVARGAGKVALNVVAHPVEMVKAATGYENWSKALDYNVPLSKRLGYALMGTVDTVSTFGGALVTKPGAAALKGVEGADKLVDAAKADLLASKLDDAAKLSGQDLARHEAWLAGEQQARDRVAKLAAANTKQEWRAAVLEIQGDKRAIQMMNRQGKGMKGAFNEELRSIYKQTDFAVEKRLKDSLAQKGVDLERYELKPTHATNPSKDPFKIGADRDITYSLYDKKTGRWVSDVPAGKVQDVYNDEFYRAAHGTRAADAKQAADFAGKLDQQCVDALHPEAYGRGPADLKTALHEPGIKFNDPTGVGKTIPYKADDWYKKAAEAAKSGAAAESEKFMSEGFRQTTKQFDNMLVRRHGALADAGAQGLKDIPDRMKQAIGTLKSAEQGVSPALIEQRLKQMGYSSPGEVATQVGEYVEAMDKLKPAAAAGGLPWRSAYTGARIVATAYQQGGGNQ